MLGGDFTYISTATTTAAFVGQRRLERVVITETAAGAITIYDNTGTDTDRPVAVFKSSIAEGSYEIGARCSNGIKVVTAAASKLTVIHTEL